MDILRRQGRIVPDDQVDPLSQFDQLVLTAVYLLHGQGDTASITEQVSEMSGQKVSQEATSLALAMLKEHFLMDSWVPDTEIEPEAENTRYFMSDDDGGTRSSSCEGNLEDRCRLSGRFRVSIGACRRGLSSRVQIQTEIRFGV